MLLLCWWFVSFAVGFGGGFTYLFELGFRVFGSCSDCILLNFFLAVGFSGCLAV